MACFLWGVKRRVMDSVALEFGLSLQDQVSQPQVNMLRIESQSATKRERKPVKPRMLKGEWRG
jgi:hypothetical protein